MRMSVANMAPCVPHSPHLVPLPYPLTYGLPGAKLSESLAPSLPDQMMRCLPWRVPEAETRRPEMRPVFRILRKALRYLRTALFKVLDRCGAVMEALHLAASPVLALNTWVGMGGRKSMWESTEEERGSTMQRWMWAPDLEVLEGEEDFWAPDEKTLDEEDFWAPGLKMVEDDDGHESVEDEGELDLAEWLEWDSDRELSEDEDLHGDDPSDTAPELPLGLYEKACIYRPTFPTHPLTSEGEQDDDDDDGDADSDWSDEDSEDWGEGTEANAELWESFLRTDDPYNPLGFSSTTGKRGNTGGPTESCIARPLHITDRERAAESETVEEAGKERNKRVRFNNDVKVRPLVAWAFASRAARDGSCWLEMARDRDRFRRRVQTVGDVIGPCLSPQHRDCVWQRLQHLSSSA